MDYTLIGAIILALDIYAIWCVLKEGRSGGSTVLWIIVILIFPIVGMLAYFLFGRNKAVL